jgi:hypothetical protein
LKPTGLEGKEGIEGTEVGGGVERVASTYFQPRQRPVDGVGREEIIYLVYAHAVDLVPEVLNWIQHQCWQLEISGFKDTHLTNTARKPGQSPSSDFSRTNHNIFT